MGFTILCWGLLIVAVSLPWRNVSSSLVPKMWMLYTWLSIYVVKGSVLSWQLLGLIPRLWKDRRMQLGLYVGLPVGLVCFGLMWWGALAGRRQIEMVRVDVASPRLPQTFEGFTIAQISDLHLGTWGNDTSFISALVDSVNAQRPDLIAFTGDLVNRSSSETAPFVRILSRLHAPCGVISVMGNHDYGDYANWTTEQAQHADVDRLRATQRSMGWLLLDNAYTSLVRGSDTIYIIGVENWGEPPFSSYGDLAAALATHVRPGDDTRLPAKGPHTSYCSATTPSTGACASATRATSTSPSRAIPTPCSSPSDPAPAASPRPSGATQPGAACTQPPPPMRTHGPCVPTQPATALNST